MHHVEDPGTLRRGASTSPPLPDSRGGKNRSATGRMPNQGDPMAIVGIAYHADILGTICLWASERVEAFGA